MYGKAFRTYHISRVIEDIVAAKSLGTRSLWFADDNPTSDVDYFGQLLDQIITYGHNDVSYTLSTSSTGIVQSEKVVKKMAQAGIRFVALGIENVSPSNLAVLNKGDIVEKSIRAIELLKQHRINVVGLMIIGNPDDDSESIEENYRCIRDMGVIIHDQILTPYPKTELRGDLLSQGLIVNPNNYSIYNGHFANVRTKHLSADELDRIKYQMVQRYSGSRWKYSWEMRNQVPKEIVNFGLKRIPTIIRNLMLYGIQRAFMSEEQRFRKDYEHCLSENQFNL